jgi:RNA polymerase sigma-70 factor (ECF subfamily)
VEFHSFDASYLDRLASGDPTIEHHFHDYFGELILIKLRARQYARQAIDDIRQETFLRVLQTLRRNGIREPERIGAFVNSVCNNVILEHGRSAAKHAVSEAEPLDQADDRADSERELFTHEMQAQVRAVLDDMTPKNRQLLSAVFLEERPSEEVCRQFGVDQNYLRVMLFRARAQFREVAKKKRLDAGAHY